MRGWTIEDEVDLRLHMLGILDTEGLAAIGAEAGIIGFWGWIRLKFCADRLFQPDAEFSPQAVSQVVSQTVSVDLQQLGGQP